VKPHRTRLAFDGNNSPPVEVVTFGGNLGLLQVARLAWGARMTLSFEGVMRHDGHGYTVEARWPVGGHIHLIQLSSGSIAMGLEAVVAHYTVIMRGLIAMA
jgi:hypothetical protein